MWSALEEKSPLSRARWAERPVHYEDAQGPDTSHTSSSVLFKGLTQLPPRPDLGKDRTSKLTQMSQFLHSSLTTGMVFLLLQHLFRNLQCPFGYRIAYFKDQRFFLPWFSRISEGALKRMPMYQQQDLRGQGNLCSLVSVQGSMK